MSHWTKSTPRFHLLLTAILSLALVLNGCGESSSATPPPTTPQHTNLPGIKTYLVQKATDLRNHTVALQQTAGQYYELAQTYHFDYTSLWQQKQEQVHQLWSQAKTDYLAANSAYELMEGIVAGVPSLAEYDTNLDAGIAASEGSEDVVTFDLQLPNGKILPKPGNYFFLAEATLWGTKAEWTVPVVKADRAHEGVGLPDANMLKGTVDGFAVMAARLLQQAQTWQPTDRDAFTALVVMIPTMEEYFQAWKASRAIRGEKATSPQFVAVSRLQDVIDILSGLDVVYRNVQPLIAQVDPAQAEQTGADLTGLRSYVDGIYRQEKAGTSFKPEDADTIGAEAQHRATTIAGQIAQAAAKLQIQLELE
jgi:hypothetical protein